MDELLNPYRPGAGVPPPALIGRDELIHRFGIVLRRALAGLPDKSLMPIGLRGVGKTVLLNRFCEIAKNEGISWAFIEAPESKDFRELLAAKLRKVLFDLRRNRLTESVMKGLRVLKAFSLKLGDGSSMTIDVEPLLGSADSGILAEDVTDLLIAVGEATRSCGSGFLLAIDEVQYLTQDEMGALIMAVHRTGQLNLPIVLAGAGLPQLPGLAGEAKSYAERLFDYPEIDRLGQDDAAAALQIPAQEANADFTPEALRYIVDEAHGYPYFLQEWGSLVWIEAPNPLITKGDAAAARPKVIEQLDKNFFLVRYDRMTPMEKQYLRAMADLGAGPHRSGDIATRLGVKVEYVGPRRKALIKKGMIYSPAHGDTAFTVPLFDEYLKRVMPDWRPQSSPKGEAGVRKN